MSFKTSKSSMLCWCCECCECCDAMDSLGRKSTGEPGLTGGEKCVLPPKSSEVRSMDSPELWLLLL